MIRAQVCAAILLIVSVLLAAPRVSHAAESYDNCTGFITSVPTVIVTQGTWCLKKDLATAMSSGHAIEIQTSNVTIDCNDFKLGGLAAGTTTQAVGIFAQDRFNLTVRHCNIRGFYGGVLFFGGTGTGGGHLVEDNRFDGNLSGGINVAGDGSVIRRNRVSDTGGWVSDFPAGDAVGVFARGSIDVIDNSISDVVATPGTAGTARGILAWENAGGNILGNRVRGVLADTSAVATGIYIQSSSRIAMRDNDLVGNAQTGSVGIACDSTTERTLSNVVNGFVTGLSGCSDDGGNVIAP